MKRGRARGKVPPKVIRSTEARTELFCRFFMALPADALGSEQFVSLKLEWESLDDQPLLEK